MNIKRDEQDVIFSNYIRRRDGYRCVLCHRQFNPNEKGGLQALHNSHFWSRANKSVRFHPKNCDAVCFGCHQKVEIEKQGDYMHFKKKQLGETAYNELEKIKRRFLKYGVAEKVEINQILTRLWETDDETELLEYIKTNLMEKV